MLRAVAASGGEPGWAAGPDISAQDRPVELTDPQVRALAELGPAGLRRCGAQGPRRGAQLWDSLSGLVGPLDAVRARLHHPHDARYRRASSDAAGLILAHCAQTGRSYWGFTAWEWARLCGASAQEFGQSRALPTEIAVRPLLVALAHGLGGFTDFQHLGTFNRLHLARLVYGTDPVARSLDRAGEVLEQWGYRAGHTTSRWRGALSQALLINRSPRLEELTTDAFGRLHAHPATAALHDPMLYPLQRVVAALGHCDPPVHPAHHTALVIQGAEARWTGWVQRWHTTSTLTPKVRAIIRVLLAKAGRWLASEYPEITQPSQWTRQTCAAWVAAVDRMCVGDYVQCRDRLTARVGTPLAAGTKAHILMASRTFFRDCQEWEWLPRRFDPARALALPRSISALIATNPRVIANEIWAKLMWAGLNLTAHDLPGNSATSYPLELFRAVALTWLFSGLRSDEITRLRLGCIRWQHDGTPIPSDSHDVLAHDAVCLLDVPVHKTGTAFTKPVDPLLGQAIGTWQTRRPTQPTTPDRKTGEHVDMLFCLRGQPIAKTYINRTIIPVLCRKAGVPATDVRGTITSHRARSTIASQLYNAKEPMTLFELQAWLGHRTPSTTQHYAKITPNTLAQAYHDAGYFARNVRTIEVLLDRDAVTTGAAATGAPWQHYDPGHGYCTYTFFEQCPHRMACARCDFYTPKGSAKAQLLEAKDNLQRILTSVPLTDDERAALDNDQSALKALLGRLTDTPTPAGPTPRQIGVPPTATLLPIIQV
ncbi:MAG: tyrosine-type recombinase/integrase, partial [Actinobacteria bacterium]|nr:tyrosine-type recombinase/integrase [Actinomycetota bacterium]